MKKLLKIIKLSFIAILSICTLFFLYFFISNKIFLESKNENNIAYLTKNNTEITNAINDKLFGEEFYKSKVFLLGEIHGYADNQKLDKELLFFLNKKIGVKYYIAEMDSLTAKNLNNFLSNSSKNQETLKEVVLAIKERIPQQSSQELFDKWNDIYDYNQKLTDSLKITVIGIDKNFDDNSKGSRDLAMVINFKNSIKKLKLENEKFYGLFGYFHVLQNKMENGKETFASELKKSGIKTTSFVSYTLDSEVYLPKNSQFPTPENEKVDWINADGPLQLVKGINDLKELSKANSITLFKLNSKNTPFLKSQHLISVKSNVFGENIVPQKNTFTTDYFQYVFLLRNSKALTKLK
ncbi:hypothetical protein H1R17_10000 [Flavobacterium sp. xlx-214]|uniref:hypothetical protein n=1 Tax=unclassified Flavobacterium TaxID=196869 RepID=UPI0013D6F4E8|nr:MULTISPECIES: hypothetical protein [unclassified Flavobacterium]MBA5793429.1 hypothetical protein [Flavobacterium sp. xlx-221]QMI82798.1 hypothetical protein H1R17_10000 [Flavobacterium sp. xlx-214]